MEQNGVDIATLGLRVDARPVEEATRALDRFRETGEKAEAQSKSFGLTADEVARLNARTYDRIAQAEEQYQADKVQREQAAAAKSAATADAAARAQIAALERAFQEESAEVRLAVASGFLKPAEAEKIGRETAARFNKGLADAITGARAQGAFKGQAGRQALVDVTQSIKDVGAEGRKAGLGLGRLNDAFVTVARQATGTSPVVGKLVDTIGTFAIGTAYMVPVLAGLAAIGYAWQAITEDAREAKRAQDEALQRLGDAARARALGPAGSVADDVANAQAAIRALKEELADLEAGGGVGGTRLGLAIGTGNELAAAAAEEERLRRIQEVTAQIQEAEERAAEGILQIRENTNRRQEQINADEKRLLDERARAAEEAARADERRRDNLQRLADETARLERQSAATVTDLDQQIADERRLAAAQSGGAQAVEALNRELTREQALREALSNAVPRDIQAITDQVNALYDLKEANANATDLRARTSAEFLETSKQLEEAHQRLTEAERERAEDAAAYAAAWRDAWVGAAVDISKALGESAGNAATFLANLNIGDVLQQGGLANLNPIAIPGFIAGGVAGILDKREERQRAVEQAREEWERVLDSYVDELADATRWERLTADATSGAEDAFGALLDSLFADLATRGSFGKEAAEKIKEQLQGSIDVEGLEAVLSKFGPEGQAILDEYRRKLERIEEQRQNEIKSQEDEIAVRRLIAQGKDEEAAALRRQLDEQAQLDAAYELGGEALRALWEELFNLEEASRAAAKAAEEAAEAQRRADTRRDFEANLGIIQANNRGDDLAAFSIGAEVQAAQDIADARKLFEDGIIDQALLDEFIEAIGIRLANAIEDTTRAIEEAARAEEYRAGVELQNLELRLLYANGLTDEALLLKQSLELQDAIFQGKSDEYIATLKQVQAAERAAAQNRRQTQALQEQSRAAEEATRALDGTSRAITRIRTEELARYRNEVLRNESAYRATDPFGVEFGTPRFGGAAGGTLRIEAGAIIVNAAPGQDPAQIAQAVIDEVAKKKRAGGVNPFGSIL